jgi:hypothetical protein
MYQGQPQKYGTQYIAEDGCWKLWDIDPATTDTERAGWDVPPLAEALAQAAEMTRANPPPASAKGPPLAAHNEEELSS